MLGGDPEKGEQLLRHVIHEVPEAVNARISLAKSYCKRGRHQDAVDHLIGQAIGRGEMRGRTRAQIHFRQAHALAAEIERSRIVTR